MATTTKTYAFATTVEGWALTNETLAYWTGALDAANGNAVDSLKGNVGTTDNSKTAVAYWGISGTWAALFGIATNQKVTQVRIYSLDTRAITFTGVTNAQYGDSTTPTNGLWCDALLSGTQLWAGRAPTGVEGSWTTTTAGSNAAVATAKQAAGTTVAFRLYCRAVWGTPTIALQMNWDNLVIEITYEPIVLEAVAVTANAAVAGVQGSGALQDSLSAVAVTANVAVTGVQGSAGNQSPLSATAGVADVAVAGVSASAANQSPLSATAGVADLAVSGVDASVELVSADQDVAALTANISLAGVQATAALQNALTATALVADLAASGVQTAGANQSALNATAGVADLAASGVPATAVRQDSLEATATVADIAVAGVQAAGVRQDSLAATATTADLLATAVNAIGVREDALEAFALTADAVAAGVDASAAAVIPRVPGWRIREYIDEFTEVDRGPTDPTGTGPTSTARTGCATTSTCGRRRPMRSTLPSSGPTRPTSLSFTQRLRPTSTRRSRCTTSISVRR